MDRRVFIGGLALGTLAPAHVAHTQPGRKIYRIGILSAFTPTSEMVGLQPRSPSVNALLTGLRELGYVYGEHFVTEPRGGEGRPERFSSLAVELVRLQVDVIIAPGPMLHALKQATATLPIVMAAAGDPVSGGVVQSLAHPGGNFTGFSLQLLETTGKRLELLKELVPRATLVAVLFDRTSLANWQTTETAAKQRGWKLLSLEVADARQIEGAFKAASGAGADALLVMASGVLDWHARRIVELAARNRLPTMYELRPYVDAGGLISYSADLVDIWRRAAVFVDKIRRGAKPADLPVEQPTKFELVVNLRTARALGLAITQALLSRADQVIEQ